MEVRGPVNQNLQSSEYSKLNGKLHRIEGPNPSSQAAESAEHSRSPEIVKLVGQLREIPEVREATLGAIREKLDNGTYLTRESAERTAAVILGKLR